MLLSGATVPVYRLLQQHKIAIDWADFLKTITAYYSKDGRLSSMPFNSSSPILYYNKDAFRKAGLAAQPPGTWTEVESVSREILAAGTARCGFTTSWPSWTMLENTFSWHNQPFATNDNGFRGLDTRLLIDSEFGQKHIGTLAKWQKEKIYAYGGRMGQPDSKFIKGECAMLVQSSAVIGAFKKDLVFDWGTGQLPHWGAPYPKMNTTLGGATLWVLRGRAPAEYRGVASCSTPARPRTAGACDSATTCRCARSSRPSWKAFSRAGRRSEQASPQQRRVAMRFFGNSG